MLTSFCSQNETTCFRVSLFGDRELVPIATLLISLLSPFSTYAYFFFSREKNSDFTSRQYR